MIALAQHLVRINSENPPGRYDEVASTYANALAAIGLEVQVVRVPDDQVSALGFDTPRVNVIGRQHGTIAGPRLIFNAHLDTVPIGPIAAWTVDPVGGEVRDGRLWGRGAVDSKGRLAAYWAATAALLRTGAVHAGELLVVATCDEEIGGDLGARWLLESWGLVADYAVVEGYNRPLVHASSGILWLEVVVQGRAAHASWPWRGHNAIVDAAAVVDELEALGTQLQRERCDIPGIPHTTMSIGRIDGGTKVNVVPERCTIQVDFRVMPGVESAVILGEVESMLDRLAATRPGFTAVLHVIQEQPPMVTSVDSPLVTAIASTVEAISGSRPEIEGEPGGTDARWFNRAGIATVNYGPGSPVGGNFHAPDENVGLDQLREAAAVCALAGYRLLGHDFAGK
ncbi:MAG: peptidase [Thermomicrobiales bacterium]|nr:peptidase [Thermomicrobiales bacterium]